MAADNSEAVILEPGLIARSYVGTWFFLDLISSVPLDYIFLVFDWIRGATLYVNINVTANKQTITKTKAKKHK